ncbi:MAG TPA: glycosyltransferase family 4 protein [Chitinophagaceae bacterium]|nr:glycosyltransferase family 4 protein [Chitinophagaceae bacterium]
MKILHVTQNYYPSLGGSQHTIKKISEFLTEHYSDKVTVITTNSYFGPHRYQFKKISPSEEVINHVKVKRFGFLRLHKKFVKSLGRLYGIIFRKPLPTYFTGIQYGPVSPALKKAVENEPCDVICASSVHYLFADYPLWRKKTSSPKPFVLYGALHLHNNDISKSYKKRIDAADYYIANTGYEKKYLVTHGIEEDKIKVIGTATDILDKADFSVSDEQLKSNYNIPANNKVISFIGRQEISKGIPTLLKAFSLITKKQECLTLVIAGAAGTYSTELEYIVAGNTNILVVTNITDLQKTEILRMSDVLVLPSVEESFGVVFIEAWAFKKPVIGANINAIASLITNNTDGLLFLPGNAQDLAEKIEYLLANKALMHELGNNGYQKFLSNYTWDIVAGRYREVYELAIKKFNKPGRA